MGKFHKINELKKYYNEKIWLRKPDENVVMEYADKMKNLIKFPGIVLGSWPTHEKFGSFGIIDGMHRYEAAKVAKVEIEVAETKEYTNVAEAMADMVKYNNQHGANIQAKDRNRRIKMLKEMGYKPADLAKTFDLSEMSISRIVRDIQGEGKSGPQTGISQTRGKPLSAKALDTLLRKIPQATRNKKAGFLDHFWLVEDDDSVTENEDAFQVLKSAINCLETLLKGVSVKPKVKS